MPDPRFDREKLRIDPAEVNGWLDKASARRRLAGPKPRGKFLRGPVPLDWLRRAACLPGKALAVGLALWFLRGVQKRRTVRLTTGTLERFGVNRWAAYRALNRLSGAGLVQVRRSVGRSPVVTILLPDRGPKE
jgi:hypothetical protein